MVPLIEVYVEADEESDASKLGYDLRVEFVSNSTIEIECTWYNPPFISANQPGDVLVVRFNGFIYD